MPEPSVPRLMAMQGGVIVWYLATVGVAVWYLEQLPDHFGEREFTILGFVAGGAVIAPVLPLLVFRRYRTRRFLLYAAASLPLMGLVLLANIFGYRMFVVGAAIGLAVLASYWDAQLHRKLFGPTEGPAWWLLVGLMTLVLLLGIWLAPFSSMLFFTLWRLLATLAHMRAAAEL